MLKINSYLTQLFNSFEPRSRSIARCFHGDSLGQTATPTFTLLCASSWLGRASAKHERQHTKYQRTKLQLTYVDGALARPSAWRTAPVALPVAAARALPKAPPTFSLVVVFVVVLVVLVVGVRGRALRGLPQRLGRPGRPRGGVDAALRPQGAPRTAAAGAHPRRLAARGRQVGAAPERRGQVRQLGRLLTLPPSAFAAVPATAR